MALKDRKAGILERYSGSTSIDDAGTSHLNLTNSHWILTAVDGHTLQVQWQLYKDCPIRRFGVSRRFIDAAPEARAYISEHGMQRGLPPLSK